ncbi:MAG: insulinase family protein [Sphingobacteriales bacterium]|nr:insulinase family protein [Sphingobacteriales bacterium]
MRKISITQIGKIPYFYIKNELNPTFALYYVLDMGTNNNRKLGLATNYLQYLGTNKYTAEQLQQEFYKLGLSFDVSTQGDRMYVVLRGLEESLDEGVKLFEHLLANAQPNEEALQAVIDDVLKSRADAKKDKNRIFSALYNYGQYGSKSPVTNILSETELKTITAQELVDLIKSLNGYKHSIFYYGNKDAKVAAKIIKKYHKPPKNLQNYPATTIYTEQPTDKPRVLFANYDMVQSQIYMLSRRSLQHQFVALCRYVWRVFWWRIKLYCVSRNTRIARLGIQCLCLLRYPRQTRPLELHRCFCWHTSRQNERCHYCHAPIVSNNAACRQTIRRLALVVAKTTRKRTNYQSSQVF